MVMHKPLGQCKWHIRFSPSKSVYLVQMNRPVVITSKFGRRQISEIDTIKYICTAPDPGHHIGKWKKTRKRHTQESQEVGLLTAADHKAARNRQDSITKTITKHN